MQQFYKQFFKTALYWLMFFAIHRLIFIVFNLKYAPEGSFLNLLASFPVGVRLDASFIGYLMLLTVVIQLLPLLILQRYCMACTKWFVYIFTVLFTGILLSDTNLFSYWARHIDGAALEFVKTPGIIMNSVRWYEPAAFVIALTGLSFTFIKIYQKFVLKSITRSSKINLVGLIIQVPLLLFVGATMILPIRGSLGVAPINTGVAYFSSNLFANNAAINPLWNLAYSMKRLDATQKVYRFMEDEKAEAIFNDLMTESGEYEKLLKTDQPNVVIILLESFGGHIIESMGGESVTPNLHMLEKEGILFSQIYAAATRSDKGLVATLAGYPVLPSYSIIQYPEKSQSLSFLPQKLKEAGYKDLMFEYGGDIEFKNMNSLVQLSGIDHVITIDDFPEEYQGEKWGVHDEYTFQRLAEEMKSAQEPYFHFFFTLSSHEPFDVPMERMHVNDYLNSIMYTDKCLGEFFKTVRKEGLWDNTLFVMIADHGTGGLQNYTYEMQEFHNIPMLWTGGALAKQDTIIDKIGSQIDMVKTLLCQLDIDSKDFRFSKNILDKESKPFAFFDYPNAMGFVEPGKSQVFDNAIGRFIHMSGDQTALDSLEAKAFLQVLSIDHKRR